MIRNQPIAMPLINVSFKKELSCLPKSTTSGNLRLSSKSTFSFPIDVNFNHTKAINVKIANFANANLSHVLPLNQH